MSETFAASASSTVGSPDDVIVPRAGTGFSCVVHGSVLTVTGTFDADAVGQFNGCIASIADTDVGVDLSAVTFIDSTALREVVLADQQLGNAGRSLHLLAPSPAVANLLYL